MSKENKASEFDSDFRAVISRSVVARTTVDCDPLSKMFSVVFVFFFDLLVHLTRFDV